MRPWLLLTCQRHVAFPAGFMPLARHIERTLEDIGRKAFYVYGFAYTAVSLAYSLRSSR